MTHRIVEAARELARTPDDMGVRMAFVRATFNLDRTATAIIELAELGSDATKEATT